ncbi:MAG: hypothetical protein GF401_06835 [Chitinivibrionales bacterium]|nr:hypothetical protein [Chitinivibrionales bacterium]
MSEPGIQEKVIQALPRYSDWQWPFKIRLLWCVFGIVGGGCCYYIVTHFMTWQLPGKLFFSVIAIAVFLVCCVPMIPITFGRLTIDAKGIRWTRLYSVQKLTWDRIKAVKNIRTVTVLGHSYYMLRLVLDDDSIEGVFSTSEEALEIFREVRKILPQYPPQSAP